MPETAFLALGSNMGDKCAQIRQAVQAIARLPQVRFVAASTIYRTPPWGKTDQDWFANAVIRIKTGLSPSALLAACLTIEKSMGRERNERWGPRAIDIDLLIHGAQRIDDARLTLPHPAMAQRAFVLVPLQEIAPDLRIDGMAISALLAGLDQSGITPLAGVEP